MLRNENSQLYFVPLEQLVINYLLPHHILINSPEKPQIIPDTTSNRTYKENNSSFPVIPKPIENSSNKKPNQIPIEPMELAKACLKLLLIGNETNKASKYKTED